MTLILFMFNAQRNVLLFHFSLELWIYILKWQTQSLDMFLNSRKVYWIDIKLRYSPYLLQYRIITKKKKIFHIYTKLWWRKFWKCPSIANVQPLMKSHKIFSTTDIHVLHLINSEWVYSYDKLWLAFITVRKCWE